VTPEAGTTVTATIPVTGGEMTTTGADGTVYTLAIPDDALLVPTEISMTPIASVTGLPTNGDQTYAVQLGPDGLHLEDFATLTIAPTKDLPVDQQIPFGYEGAGNGMFLAYPVVKETRIQLRILHFSGYGVTKGLLASIEPVRQQLGGDAEARLTSYLVSFLAKERVLESSGQEVPSDYWDALGDIIDAYERDVVEPRVAAADKSCANAQLAWLSVLSLIRQRQLFPGDKPQPDTGQLQTTLAHVCTKEEYELCRDEHIVHRMLAVILGFERQRQLPNGHPDEVEWQYEKAMAKKCLTFEVRFVSVGHDTRFPLDVVSKVKATVKISLDTESMKITGESALDNTSIDIRQTLNSDCTVKGVRGGSVFKVTDLRFNATRDTYETVATLTSRGHVAEPGKLTDLTLTYLFTESTESGTMKCPQTPLQTLSGPWWSATYFGTHGKERTGPDGSYIAKAWKTKDRVEKVGTKEWHKPGTAGLAEDGSFELYHQPS
jgi:hypothetical protein